MEPMIKSKEGMVAWLTVVAKENIGGFGLCMGYIDDLI